MENCIFIEQDSSTREKPKYFGGKRTSYSYSTISTTGYAAIWVNDASSLADERKITSLYENINRLKSFLRLGQNWNNHNANPFSDELVEKAFNILTSLDYSPEIFPTGRNSIQFEFGKKNEDYLEFEVFDDKILHFSMINGNPVEEDLSDSIQINQILTRFYAR